MLSHTMLISDLVGELRGDSASRQGAAAPRATDLGALLERWTQAMRPAANVREIGLRLILPGRMPSIPFHPGDISRVLVNLLDNAIAHTPPMGFIVVRAVSELHGVQVHVDDTGPGIPTAVREAVGERAVAPVARSSPAAGRGLGLAIARSVVESHGGFLWIATPRQGASVRFSLPA
jgi:signal transduction histidine kinase